MNIDKFTSELSKRLKVKNIKLNQSDTKIVITEFIKLIKELVFEGYEIKIKNFGKFFLDFTSDKRKLPNGTRFEKRSIIRFRLSKNFKNK